MKTNIENLTVAECREIVAMFAQQPTVLSTCKAEPYTVGENYFIRTVTFHFTGRLVEVHQNELVLIDAAWIADSGRFADAIRKSEFSEVEPFPDGQRVIIGRNSIIDATVIEELPRTQK